MTLGTHVAFASVLYLGGATLFGYKPDWIGWLLAAAASLLPDVDLPPAKIGRLFWFLSGPLERRFGHRTLTHSAVGAAGHGPCRQRRCGSSIRRTSGRWSAATGRTCGSTCSTSGASICSGPRRCGW